MEVRYRPGPRIIVGSLPVAGVPVTISDPWGNATTVTSGSKPEHGLGGFEVLAPHNAIYTLTLLGEIFEVKMQDRSAIVAFAESAPSGPEPEPGSEPEPRPSPGSEWAWEPPVDHWALLFEKLTRIEELITKLGRE
jgi:hypothetical protein